MPTRYYKKKKLPDIPSDIANLSDEEVLETLAEGKTLHAARRYYLEMRIWKMRDEAYVEACRLIARQEVERRPRAVRQFV